MILETETILSGREFHIETLRDKKNDDNYFSEHEQWGMEGSGYTYRKNTAHISVQGTTKIELQSVAYLEFHKVLGHWEFHVWPCTTNVFLNGEDRTIYSMAMAEFFWQKGA